MTSYFDKATHAVAALSPALEGDDYLDQVAFIEEPVIRDVQLNTGDREFPDDLREKILGLIATRTMAQPTGLPRPSKAARQVLATRASALLGVLHSAFHDLAGRRLEARFGRWSDSPTQNLLSRDTHDDPEAADLERQAERHKHNSQFNE